MNGEKETEQPRAATPTEGGTFRLDLGLGEKAGADQAADRGDRPRVPGERAQAPEQGAGPQAAEAPGGAAEPGSRDAGDSGGGFRSHPGLSSGTADDLDRARDGDPERNDWGASGGIGELNLDDDADGHDAGDEHDGPKPEIVGAFAPGGERYAEVLAKSKSGNPNVGPPGSKTPQAKRPEPPAPRSVTNVTPPTTVAIDPATKDPADASAVSIEPADLGALEITPEVSNPDHGVLLRMNTIPRWDEFTRQSAAIARNRGHYVGVTAGDDVSTGILLSATPRGSKLFLFASQSPQEKANDPRLQAFVGDTRGLVNEFITAYQRAGGTGIAFVYFGNAFAETVRETLEAFHDAGVLAPQAVIVFERFWGYAGWEGGQFAGLEAFSRSRGRAYGYLLKGRDCRASVMLRD